MIDPKASRTRSPTVAKKVPINSTEHGVHHKLRCAN